MANPDLKKLKVRNISRMIVYLISFFILSAFITYASFIYIHLKPMSVFLITYALLSFGYLIYRYVFSLAHSVEELKIKKYTYAPKVSIIIPVYNENSADLEKCIVASCVNSYPNKEVIVIDDGSKMKETWETIARLEKKYHFKTIKFEKNKGKREGMYAGFHVSTGDVLITMDSDSIIVNGDSIRELVEPLKNKKVGAVAGNIQVLNKDTSWISKVQWARYWTAFNIEKASQSPYSSVTCCSGPFSAYRKEYLMEYLEEWINQKFLGERCTYGDDRGLTTLMLRNGYNVKFSKYALCLTNVPEKLRTFTKQQIRWKKSFIRENYYIGKFITDKNAMMQTEFFWFWIVFFMGFLTKFLGIYYILSGTVTLIAFGIMIIFSTMIHYIYSFIRKPGIMGFYGILYGFIHEFLVVWLFWIALFQLKQTGWGTR